MDTGTLKDLARASFRLVETGDERLARQIIDPEFVNHEAEDDPEDAEPPAQGSGRFPRHRRVAARCVQRTALRASRDGRRRADGHGRVRHDRPATGTFQGIPATGRAFSQKQVHILTISGSRIRAHRAVRDDLGLLLQLGWRPGRG